MTGHLSAIDAEATGRWLCRGEGIGVAANRQKPSRGRGVGRPQGLTTDECITADVASLRTRHPLPRSDEIDGVIFQYETGQSTRRESPGIDINSIWPNVRLHYRRMTVDDNLVELVFTKKKIFTDPQQVLFTLLIQCDTGTHPRMGEKVVSTRE